MMALWPAMNLIFDAFRLLHGVGLREDGLRFGVTGFGLKVQGSCLKDFLLGPCARCRHPKWSRIWGLKVSGLTAFV